jgi:hypothetical protein
MGAIAVKQEPTLTGGLVITRFSDVLPCGVSRKKS